MQTRVVRKDWDFYPLFVPLCLSLFLPVHLSIQLRVVQIYLDLLALKLLHRVFASAFCCFSFFIIIISFLLMLSVFWVCCDSDQERTHLSWFLGPVFVCCIWREELIWWQPAWIFWESLICLIPIQSKYTDVMWDSYSVVNGHVKTKNLVVRQSFNVPVQAFWARKLVDWVICDLLQRRKKIYHEMLCGKQAFDKLKTTYFS